MKTEQDVIYLKDYQPHPFQITHSDIHFSLGLNSTLISTTHEVSKRQTSGAVDTLILDCEKMQIESVSIDGILLQPEQYRQDDNHLAILNVPEICSIHIVNTIQPDHNTELSGLYQSSDMLCTQCEAEGFRRITPSIDRPDNLATYRVTLSGSRKLFPIMLSNGNLESASKSGDEHIQVWQDPFPKPTYLFAVVAGPLSEMRDTFRTRSGRDVSLRFYARDEDIEKCEYAMGALKRSMTWDEEVYGREYDLDLFNVVAVGDFNMGAMENKSLNIFNTKYVLADPDLATDTDFMNVERVIAHEYFHNWSGNRVTCRDWFQLSLKEGFTVFRDQEFSADTNSRGVQRIGDVNTLRNHQFPEDAGPMAHPVRPAYYQEINNFYTVTIYEKGAEVVRMLRTLIGTELFRKGSDLYFERHDGQAVTTDDFVAAMSDASGKDLQQFIRWYSQAGTPRLAVSHRYDADAKTYTLEFSQSCPETPDGVIKAPFLIPVKIALFNNDGSKIHLGDGKDEVVIEVNAESQQQVFHAIAAEPVPSVLREFTSPVILQQTLGDTALQTLFLHDDDPFNRWEAGQQLLTNTLLDNIGRLHAGKPCRYPDSLMTVLGKILGSIETDDIGQNQDLSLIARLLTLPGHAWLCQLSQPIDPHAIAEARIALGQKIASTHYLQMRDMYLTLQQANSGGLSQQQMGIRELRNSLLSLLCSLDTRETRELAETQLQQAGNMTDRASAFEAVVNSTSGNKQQLIEDFYQSWKQHPLVVDKWLRIQATARTADSLSLVTRLTAHPAFDSGNPNKVYALILGATQGNPLAFHQKNGDGYRFLADWVIKMNATNPQIAARLASGFNQWKDMVPEISDAMQVALKLIQSQDNLSANVSEIVDRALA